MRSESLLPIRGGFLSHAEGIFETLRGGFLNHMEGIFETYKWDF